MVTRQTKILSLDQQVTVQVERGNFIRFQADTGAECNVLPLGVYTGANTEGALVFATDKQCTISQSPLTKEELQERFPSVFC